MTRIKNLVRKNIQDLKPYSSARDEFSGTEGIFLDANENPFGKLNRYPDPYQKKLKAKLSALKNISAENIFIGNGSDEIIDLAFRIFCNPGKDKALAFSPSYGMYEVSANINQVDLIKVALTKDFQIDKVSVAPFLNDSEVKILFICSPNNPTGNVFCESDIQFLLNEFNGIVIIDEAYIDFATSASWIIKTEKYSNLIVCQTFSKAWGLAGARVGAAYANKEIIAYFNKVKPPYNISQLNQETVLSALDRMDVFEINKKVILKQKASLLRQLSEISCVNKIYPTDANFVLVEVKDANSLYKRLVAQKIIIRNRTKLIENCIRITIGSPAENQTLLQELKKIK